jgi:hypothetical protein
MNGKSQAPHPPFLPGPLQMIQVTCEVVHCVISWHIIDMSLEWHFSWHKLSESSLANDNFIEANVIRKGLTDRAGSIIGMMHILLRTKCPGMLGWVRWHVDAEHDKSTYLYPYDESILDIVATLGDTVCWTISIYNPKCMFLQEETKRYHQFIEFKLWYVELDSLFSIGPFE